jgi:hypothetical protein
MMKMGSFLSALSIGKMLIFAHRRFDVVFPLQVLVVALVLVEGLVLVLILGEEVVVELAQVLVPPLVAQVEAVLAYSPLLQLARFLSPSPILSFVLVYLLYCHSQQSSIYALILAK